MGFLFCMDQSYNLLENSHCLLGQWYKKKDAGLRWNVSLNLWKQEKDSYWWNEITLSQDKLLIWRYFLQ